MEDVKIIILWTVQKLIVDYSNKIFTKCRCPDKLKENLMKENKARVKIPFYLI